jgi:nickel-type superoxide dismutase maturation protease
MIFLRRVVGDSMKPTLRNGQAILVHNGRNFRRGQVVVAHVGSREVVKRIQRVENGRIFLQGDNADESTDSREYGSIIDTSIAGIVIWPRVTRNS